MMELSRTGAQDLQLADLKALETSWLEYLGERRDVTLQSYRVSVGSFIEWAGDNGVRSISTLRRSDIIEYIKYLRGPHISRKTGRTITLSVETQKRYFRGLKMFLRWASAHGHPHAIDLVNDVLPPRSGDTTRWHRDYLSREDVLTVLESIDRSSELGLRNYSMIFLCVSCGLRIIELQRADIADIEEIGGVRRIAIQGKNHASKDTYKTVTPEVWEALDEYLRARKMGSQDTKDAPLFAACESNAKQGGGRLTEQSISRIIKGVLVHAGYDSRRISAHSLRHTSITLDRLAGASIEEVSRHARHASRATTEQYDHMLETRAANDEARIVDYILSGKDSRTEQERAADLIARIPADKRAAALDLLAALAE